MSGEAVSQTLLVICATGGIGSAVVRRFVATCTRVVATDVDAGWLAMLAEREPDLIVGLGSDASDVTFAELDVEAADLLCRVDTVANTVGRAQPGALTQLPLAEWDATLDLPLRTAAIYAGAALPAWSSAPASFGKVSTGVIRTQSPSDDRRERCQT